MSKWKIGLCLVLVLVLGFSVFQIWKQLAEEAAVTAQNEALISQTVTVMPEPAEEEASEEAPVQPPISVDFGPILEQNPDVVAWLWCEGTKINYPVAQGKDNKQYLRSLLDGSYNRAGTIFMDYRNEADFSHINTIIYGHNMKNISMFGSLPNYAHQAYYDAHPVWWLLTPEKTYRVDLFAAYTTQADALLYTMAETELERQRLVDTALQFSDFVSSVEVEAEDPIVTFSTCLYEKKDSRYVVLGVLREVEETGGTE